MQQKFQQFFFQLYVTSIKEEVKYFLCKGEFRRAFKVISVLHFMQRATKTRKRLTSGRLLIASSYLQQVTVDLLLVILSLENGLIISLYTSNNTLHGKLTTGSIIDCKPFPLWENVHISNKKCLSNY